MPMKRCPGPSMIGHRPMPEINRGRLFGVVVALALAACTPAGTGYPLLDGGSLDFAALKGRVVFINYWAEWCAPCREEIPEFNAFAAAHPDRVQVLSVNFDGVSDAALAAQARGLGIEFPTLLRDPRPELGAAPPMGLPETLVLDRAGRLTQVLRGPQTRAALEAVLAAIP
jgi:thiol-disulfide isomerase/thioredoxin